MPLHLDGGAAYISASNTRQLLDSDGFPVAARYRYVAPTGTVTLRLDRDDEAIMVRMVAGSPEVALSDRSPVTLGNAPIAGDGDLWVPLDFMVRVVPALLPVSVQYDAQANRLVVGALDPEPSVDASDPGPTGAEPAPSPAVGMPYFSTTPRPATWTGLIVVLDPGHGGNDPGVQGNGIIEKDDAFRLARDIAGIAQRMNTRVYLARLSDEHVNRHARAQVAAARKASAYVALHFNSSLSPGASGYRLVINNTDDATSEDADIPASARRSALPESRRLADALEAALNAVGFDGERLELPVETLPELPIAAVHLEVAYVTNPDEAVLWQDPRTRRYVAEAVWAGLARYRP